MTNQSPTHWSICLSIASRSWRSILGFVAPIVLIPFLLDYQNKVSHVMGCLSTWSIWLELTLALTWAHFCLIQASLCAYVLVLMIIYWMFEPINLYVTGDYPCIETKHSLTLIRPVSPNSCGFVSSTWNREVCLWFVSCFTIWFFSVSTDEVCVNYMKVRQQIAGWMLHKAKDCSTARVRTWCSLGDWSWASHWSTPTYTAEWP